MVRVQCLLLSMVCGCAGNIEPPATADHPELPLQAATSSAAAPLRTENGSNLNGSNLNGSNLNGSNLNGDDPASVLASVSLAGVRVGHLTLHQVTLNGTIFTGSIGAVTWHGTEFEGAELTGLSGDGTPVTLRIQQVLPGSAKTADLWTYRVEHRDAAGAWWPLCRDPKGPGTAVPLMGRWDLRSGVPGGGDKIADPGAFTFACMETSAIAKCVSAGYKPWASAGGVSLDATHQACVRLLRADFCGDGRSHTKNGRRVNLYDAHGIQSDTEAWAIEAEWDQNGARCYSLLNRSSSLLPVCGGIQVSLSCGERSHFKTGTLLINEVPLLGTLL